MTEKEYNSRIGRKLMNSTLNGIVKRIPTGADDAYRKMHA